MFIVVRILFHQEQHGGVAMERTRGHQRLIKARLHDGVVPGVELEADGVADGGHDGVRVED